MRNKLHQKPNCTTERKTHGADTQCVLQFLSLAFWFWQTGRAGSPLAPQGGLWHSTSATHGSYVHLTFPIPWMWFSYRCSSPATAWPQSCNGPWSHKRWSKSPLTITIPLALPFKQQDFIHGMFTFTPWTPALITLHIIFSSSCLKPLPSWLPAGLVPHPNPSPAPFCGR